VTSGKQADRIQEGVFFRSGERPPPHWRLLLLNLVEGTGSAEAHDAVDAALGMLASLRAGRVRDLKGQPADGAEATKETFGELTALIGYGRRFFDPARHGPPLTTSVRPEFLSYLPRSDEPFPALPWVEAGSRRGEADLAVQITGATEASTNRAAVEVWKLIEDERLPLDIVASFDGFGRIDGRGWLEFHDGVGNMASSQRIDAISAGADPDWMAGGTYMAFLRLRVDLRVWRALERSSQELIVGRDKLTGSPLAAVKHDPTGRACPVSAPQSSRGAKSTERADPPQTTDPLLEASHIHRANQNRSSAAAAAGLRIFRQGYEFLDAFGPRGPELGLNFVSFQSDLGTFQHLMHLPGWLGDVNFGGPAAPGPGEPASPALLALAAGGFYALPPRARPFPGARLFDS
jgi:deferrochelatase/peroxidase EfeB